MRFEITTVMIPYDEGVYDDEGLPELPSTQDDERGELKAQVLRDVGESDDGCIRLGCIGYDSLLGQHLFVQSPEPAGERLTRKELLAFADVLKKFDERQPQ